MSLEAITVICEDCHATTTFPSSSAGSTQMCPECAAYVDVPDGTEEEEDDEWWNVDPDALPAGDGELAEGEAADATEHDPPVGNESGGDAGPDGERASNAGSGDS